MPSSSDSCPCCHRSWPVPPSLSLSCWLGSQREGDHRIGMQGFEAILFSRPRAAFNTSSNSRRLSTASAIFSSNSLEMWSETHERDILVIRLPSVLGIVQRGAPFQPSTCRPRGRRTECSLPLSSQTRDTIFRAWFVEHRKPPTQVCQNLLIAAHCKPSLLQILISPFLSTN